MRPLVQKAGVVRPVRNLTPYYVSVYLDRKSVAVLPPCYGPSMITTPTGEFKLQAAASLVMSGGQKQIEVKIIPGTNAYGWDIVPDTGDPVAFKAN